MGIRNINYVHASEVSANLYCNSRTSVFGRLRGYLRLLMGRTLTYYFCFKINVIYTLEGLLVGTFSIMFIKRNKREQGKNIVLVFYFYYEASTKYWSISLMHLKVLQLLARSLQHSFLHIFTTLTKTFLLILDTKKITVQCSSNTTHLVTSVNIKFRQ